uniref:uncharacterized protein LOC122606112 n=1 Tax=Erigeron canadensis TaxID=72917 RepID=UPI001CB93158|nr:uncharacterized protein LOC122606112 [Erigeron canadensis]
MASLYNHYVATTSFLDKPSKSISGLNHVHSFSIPNLVVKNRFPRICAEAVVGLDGHHGCNKIVNDDKEYYDRKDKLDEWVQGSVTEIVKNIRQVPLLVQIYANGEVKTEKAVKSKSWPNVITERSSSPPEGIILVEEIKESKNQEYSFELNEEGGTKAFGVLIQGKTTGRYDGCKSACYLLETTCNFDYGAGFTCSHFCLMKVKSFNESASSQLKSCWLVD